MLDLPIGNFHLATSLRMVRNGCFVHDEVHEKLGFEKPIAKVLTFITDDDVPGSTESTEDVGLDEF